MAPVPSANGDYWSSDVYYSDFQLVKGSYRFGIFIATLAQVEPKWNASLNIELYAEAEVAKIWNSEAILSNPRDSRVS